MINMFLNFGSSPKAYNVSNPDTNPLLGSNAEPQVSSLCYNANCVAVYLSTVITNSLGVGCNPKPSGGAGYFVRSMDANDEANLRIHQEKEG